MTVSVNNDTNEICMICHEDCMNAEREDTAKVVELACHHFYHLSCLSSWFSIQENHGQDLSCCYCTQVSMPKIEPLSGNKIDVEILETHFARIENNEDFKSDPKVMNCLKQFKPLSEHIVDLINEAKLDLESDSENDCTEKQFTPEFKKKLILWVQDNIQEELRAIACQLLGEIVDGSSSLRTLDQEIKRLAEIPLKKWHKEINKKGFPVSYSANNGDVFRMRVSGEYLQKATCTYIYERIHDIEKFEHSLAEIEKYSFYDQEVLDCIQDTKNLREDISNLIKENSTLSMERMILLIEEMVKKTKVGENSKLTILLIIKEALFHRGALRTWSQEVDRWKKEPIEKWPAEIMKNGIIFLDKDDSPKRCNIEHFIQCVKPTPMVRKICDVAISSLIVISIGFLVTKILNSK